MLEIENAIGWYYANIWKEWVYVKIQGVEIPKIYKYSGKWAVAESKEEIKLDADEWGLLLEWILTIKRRNVFWKVMSFVESLWGTEETVKARKSVIWQLLD